MEQQLNRNFNRFGSPISRTIGAIPDINYKESRVFSTFLHAGHDKHLLCHSNQVEFIESFCYNITIKFKERYLWIISSLKS